MNDKKNTWTNVIALVLALVEPVRAYLESNTFQWDTFILCVGGAIVSFLTGKTKDGKKKV